MMTNAASIMPDSGMPVYGRHHADVEAQIQQLRAALLHKEQEHELVQLQLAKEKEERERAERQVFL